MSEIKRVVSVGAHSLDAELLGGPLLIKYADEGAHVTAITVTRGRLENGTDEEKRLYLKAVESQEIEAAKKLGGDNLFLGYTGSNMPSLNEFADRMEKYFIEEKVDLVITHWRGSMHPRHINTHDAVTEAVKRMRRNGYNIKLLYGETFEDLVGFIPQAYYVLNESETERWFDALNCYQVYRGEVNNFPYTKYYPTNLQVRQIESGSKGNTVCYMYASLIENTL